MKSFILLIAMSLLSPAYAYINEIECEGNVGAERISVEIEKPFPNGSSMRWVKLITNQNSYNYSVNARRVGGLNRIEYRGGGFNLELDFWPDQRPQWGRTYRGSLNSFDLYQNRIIPLYCRFPNI